jgi:lactate permease
VSAALGSLGEFRLSAGGVLGLSGIFGTEVGFEHALLYVPSLLPFGLISLLAFAWCGSGRGTVSRVWSTTVRQMRGPVCALLGALVFVSLMMMGGSGSAVALIGEQLAALTGGSWPFFASYLGALGSFFSGSATISNLTFGSIQNELALELGLDRTTILAMQSVGGAMGNMVCVNNIVAVASVLGLRNQEGCMITRTVWSMLVYGILVGVVSVVLF